MQEELNKLEGLMQEELNQVYWLILKIIKWYFLVMIMKQPNYGY